MERLLGGVIERAVQAISMRKVKISMRLARWGKNFRYGVADELVNVSDASYAVVGFGVSRGIGFAGAGRVACRATVHSFFIFITEAAGGPRSVRRALPSGIDRTYY
jgi:hypothetical protein